MNKIKLMKEICDWYNYEMKEVDNKVIVFDGGNSYFEYDSIDEALKDWLETLLGSNVDAKREGKENANYCLWNKEIIDFIESL